MQALILSFILAIPLALMAQPGADDLSQLEIRTEDRPLDSQATNSISQANVKVP